MGTGPQVARTAGPPQLRAQPGFRRASPPGPAGASGGRSPGRRGAGRGGQAPWVLAEPRPAPHGRHRGLHAAARPPAPAPRPPSAPPSAPRPARRRLPSGTEMRPRRSSDSGVKWVARRPRFPPRRRPGPARPREQRGGKAGGRRGRVSRPFGPRAGTNLREGVARPSPKVHFAGRPLGVAVATRRKRGSRGGGAGGRDSGRAPGGAPERSRELARRAPAGLEPKVRRPATCREARDGGTRTRPCHRRAGTRLWERVPRRCHSVRTRRRPCARLSLGSRAPLTRGRGS